MEKNVRRFQSEKVSRSQNEEKNKKHSSYVKQKRPESRGNDQEFFKKDSKVTKASSEREKLELPEDESRELSKISE